MRYRPNLPGARRLAMQLAADPVDADPSLHTVVEVAATASVTASPPLLLDKAALEVWERPLHQNRSWPVTRLASWSLTLALALCVLVPVAGGDARAGQWLLLVPAVIGVTLCTRALFEVLGLGRELRGVAGHLAVAIVPALAASALMACACALTNVAWSPLAGALTAVLCAVALTTAGALRAVEIDLRQRMRRVYFIGAPAWLRDLAHELSQHGDRQLVGYRTLQEDARGLQTAGLVADVRAARSTVLVLDPDAMRFPALADVASRLDRAGLEICELGAYYEQEFKKVPVSDVSSAWFRFDRKPARSGLRAALYRALELMLAAGLLVLVLPSLVLIGVLIRLTSRGPALYRQVRVGKGGRPFTLIKLRTMTESADGTPAWAPTQAHRVTRLGRGLRRFRIDELPQFWNVLRGDLALIGPRPEQVPIVELLERRLPHYSDRHLIRPGITGWAQVNLHSGGSVEGALAKLRGDLYYVKYASLRLDALILWLTLKAVLAGRG